MKYLITFLLLANTANALPPSDQRLMDTLRELIIEKEFLVESDGELTLFECGSYYDGISCSVAYTFIDTGSYQTGPGDAYQCRETIAYRGGDSYYILQSDCWFRE